MSRNSKIITLICGTVSIAVTIMFYLLAVDNVFTIPIRYLSAVFLILSECIVMIKVLRIRKTIFGIANITTSVCQLLLVSIMSIVFVNIYPQNIGNFIFLNILVLCVMFVVDIAIGYFGQCKIEKDEAANECRGVMDDICVMATELQIEYCGSKYEKDLNAISEMLTYSDKNTPTGDEAVISDRLKELRKLLSGSGKDAVTSEISENNKDIPQKISYIKNVIECRSIKVKKSKRGGF